MTAISQILVALIAALHLYILWFEMFARETRGPKIFASFDRDMFPKTRDLAANMGLYNGFLAAGLIWSLLIGDVDWARNVALFFLTCVAVAGVYGAQVSRRIIYVQALPAVVAIASIVLL